MIDPIPSDVEKRKTFRQSLYSGRLLRLPGAFSPLVAMLIEQSGFEGVYVSGAVVSANLGLPDIGLTSVTEVTQTASTIARATRLPTIVDLDTGFGEPVNVARAIRLAEDAGLVGGHLEDQTLPKRCGHLDHKELIDIATMARKIQAAIDARRDRQFCIIARTDARGVEGLDGALDRARAYVDAGADLIFPEALESEREFEQFRKEVSVPLLANMTEFGKSPLLSTQQLENLGYNVAIFPVTLLRLAMQSVERGLKVLAQAGTQAEIVHEMQTRARLYEVIGYEKYAQWDQKIVNFRLEDQRDQK